MTRQQMTGSPGDSSPARARPRFTSRAAVLVVVVCAIALSLAYPVREYLAQLRQIDQLEAQQGQIAGQLSKLRAERAALSSSAYVAEQARDRLHMCLPTQTCYVIINPKNKASTASGATAAGGQVAAKPWYERLWTSVHDADKAPPR
jgi:cell division protein FtsB